MSRNSSPKKNSITSSDEYDRLSDLYREAYDRIQSGGPGAGWSGIHCELMNALRQYGKAPNSRDEAIHMLRKLLDEYETNYLGKSQKQSDEDYLQVISKILSRHRESSRNNLLLYFQGIFGVRLLRSARNDDARGIFETNSKKVPRY